MESLWFDRQTTSKCFEAREGVPCKLHGVPGDPLMTMFASDTVVDLKAVEEFHTESVEVALWPH